MATINSSSQFTSYILSEQEEISGSIFIQDQKQLIQNLICSIASQLLALTPDPLNYPVFIQAEAHLKGQLHAYQYLLDCSIASEQAALDLARNNVAN